MLHKEGGHRPNERELWCADDDLVASTIIVARPPRRRRGGGMLAWSVPTSPERGQVRSPRRWSGWASGPAADLQALVRQRADPAWEEAVDGAIPDWDRLLAGYASTVGWPGCHFWREPPTATRPRG
ncbi:MAG: hypothetical protein U1E17_03285 [Geminicoccaceae bacterium]